MQPDDCVGRGRQLLACAGCKLPYCGRQYGVANDEANRPTLVATIETPAVVNKTTNTSYTSLNEAFSALTGDAELVINEDIKLSDRCTLSQAYTITITASKDCPRVSTS